MRTITFIIVHCSATRCNASYSFEQCRRDHISRGWSDIVYHYYITRDGVIHTGRPETVVGAHCKNLNRHSIGVCYEGGLSEEGYAADTRTPEQKASLRSLILDLRDFSPDLNGNGIVEPHEWLKQCPCFDAYYEYKFLL